MGLSEPRPAESGGKTGTGMGKKGTQGRGRSLSLLPSCLGCTEKGKDRAAPLRPLPPVPLQPWGNRPSRLAHQEAQAGPGVKPGQHWGLEAAPSTRSLLECAWAQKRHALVSAGNLQMGAVVAECPHAALAGCLPWDSAHRQDCRIRRGPCGQRRPVGSGGTDARTPCAFWTDQLRACAGRPAARVRLWAQEPGGSVGDRAELRYCARGVGAGPGAQGGPQSRGSLLPKRLSGPSTWWIIGNSALPPTLNNESNHPGVVEF